VVLVPEDLAVERVKHRFVAGGHDVPEHKIRERHRRLWELVDTAMTLSDNATVYENSRRKGPRSVAQLSGGVVVGSPSWPDWTPAPLRERWPH
jgi:predicted ABC-type ATPase